MKLNVTQEGQRCLSMRLPRWLYLNSLGVTLIALRRDVPIRPRQARRALRAVKKAMRKHHLQTLVQVEVVTDNNTVNIDV